MRVHVEGRERAYEAMFEAAGHKCGPLTYDKLSGYVVGADLVCFTGGADVNPALYGEEAHETTGFNTLRDEASLELYEKAKKLDIPCVGICRGAQFLNVMSGGSMYQNVSGHATGRTHSVYDYLTDLSVGVSSTHHQMMIPDTGVGDILADASIDGKKEGAPVNYTGGLDFAEEYDCESVMYEEAGNLCFQPHPEFYGPEHECFKLFFSHLNHFMTRLELK